MQRVPGAPTSVGALAAEAPAGGPILLVEDDEILWHFMAALLEEEGFEVLRAADGESALRLLERLEPCLLVLDANINSPSCSEFLRRLHRQRGELEFRIIAVVMPGQSGLRRIARGLGVNDFITEPFEPARLVGAARSLALREVSA